MTELIVALDVDDAQRALALIRATSGRVAWYKVGYEAYYGYGDRILGALREAGKSIFLDLKLHDIPNTVRAGVNAASRLGAKMLTVHAAGGRAMLETAAQARDESVTGMRLIAVTVLTSMHAEDLRATGVDRDVHEVAAMRARLAAQCGIDGIVCAVADIGAVREAASRRMSVICPGIRPAGAAAGDQQRVATPADAVRAGADYVVVGRAITEAADPDAAARSILAEMETSRVS